MSRVFVFSCVRVFALATVCCAAVSATQTAPQPRTIDKGDQSNIDAPRQALVRTPAEWEALWHMHTFDRARPAVDFSREMVVAVFMGTRPNAGYSVEVVSALEKGGALIVRYRETAPSPGAVTAQILTFPYHIVAFPKVNVTDVRFEKIADR